MPRKVALAKRGGYTEEQARAVLGDFFRYVQDSPNNGLDAYIKIRIQRDPIRFEDVFTYIQIENDFIQWTQVE